MTPTTQIEPIAAFATSEPASPNLDIAALHPLLKRVPILASLKEEDLACLDGIEQVQRQQGDMIVPAGRSR